MSFNKIENLEFTLLTVAKKFPALRHLNLMKNPINPMFGKDDKYEKFRCMFKVWMPSLQTLDGVDFAKNQSALRKYEKEINVQKDKILARYPTSGSGPTNTRLEPIPELPEEGGRGKKDVFAEDVLKDMKNKKKGANAGGTNF